LLRRHPGRLSLPQRQDLRGRQASAAPASGRRPRTCRVSVPRRSARYQVDGISLGHRLDRARGAEQRRHRSPAPLAPRRRGGRARADRRPDGRQLRRRRAGRPGAGRVPAPVHLRRADRAAGRRSRRLRSRYPRPVREWWLRTALVLQSPRAVFVALRDDKDDTAFERAEPVLLIILLAGTAAALASDASTGYHGLLLAVWAFVAGGITGTAAYWLLGAVLYWAARALGSLGSYRRAGAPGRWRGGLAGLVPAGAARGRVRERAARDLPALLAGRARRLPVALPRLRRLVGGAAPRRRALRPRLDVAAGSGGRRRTGRGAQRAARPLSAVWNRSSSSSGIAYVGCSSGNAPLRTSATDSPSAEPISSASRADR